MIRVTDTPSLCAKGTVFSVWKNEILFRKKKKKKLIPHFLASVSRIPFFVSKILKFKKQRRIQGRGPRSPPPPPYFRTKLRPEGPKHFFGRSGPSLSQGVDLALKRPIAAEANNSVRRWLALSINILNICLDCSQSPIFSWNRFDIPRLTVTGILIFTKM